MLLLAVSLLPLSLQIPTEILITRQERALDDLLGGNAIKVHTTSQAGLELYSRWLDQALSSLMSAVAQEHIHLATSLDISHHDSCTNQAKTVKNHAKCVTRLLDSIEEKKEMRLEKRRKKRDIMERPITEERERWNVITKDHYSLKSFKDEHIFNSITRLVTGFTRLGKKKKKNTKNWNSLYSSVMKMKKDVAVDRFFHRLSKKQNSDSKAVISRNVMKMIKQGTRLGSKLTGKNVTANDSQKIRVISPRLLSLVPEDKTEERDLLSPSLFSLHGEGRGLEKEASLHNLLSKIDRNAPENFIEMLTEVTGLSDTLEQFSQEGMEKESAGVLANSKGQKVTVSKKNLTEIYGDQGYRTLKVLEKLHSSYTEEQVEKLNSTGYMVMNKEQLEVLYGRDSPFRNLKVIKRNQNLTKEHVEKEIKKAIHHLATGKASFSHRMKDYVLSPVLNAALIATPTIGINLILSPAIFTPLILSPAIFGSVILSPWLFVPLILSPRMFSPVIIGPYLFSPLILSPILGNPAVLSPGVANPLILSPVALSPAVLSPKVLSPNILAPLCLSPLVFSPHSLSPLILSPFFLSPSVHSQIFGGGLILSPYALSPSIGPPPVGEFLLFGSPSFLS